jgi:hypothetical protein
MLTVAAVDDACGLLCANNFLPGLGSQYATTLSNADAQEQ